MVGETHYHAAKTAMAFLMLLGTVSLASDARLLQVFPKSPVSPTSVRNWTLTRMEQYAPSGSIWAEGLDERDVFHAAFIHKEDETTSWEMRLGKGGQIYSLLGPFGEAIAPQWRRSHEQRAPWMDEVIQLVAVDSSKNLRGKTNFPISMRTAYFIHQAGVYPRDPILEKGTFYSPLFAEEWNEAERSYSMLNWGQQAHIPSIHKSSALYYEKIRDIGDSAIEITYVIYNFGDDTFDYLNTPWGGVRRTSLPDHVLSRPDGTYEERDARFNSGREAICNIKDTGGWAAFAQNGNDPEGCALAWVFGRDKHYDEQSAGKETGKSHFQPLPTRWRWGIAGGKVIEKDKRNLVVACVNPRCRVCPGEAFFFRFYLIVGKLKDVAVKANRLAEAVDYGPLDFSQEKSPLIPLHLKRESNGQVVLTRTGQDGQPPVLSTYAQPVRHSLPLFLMRDAQTGRYVLSFDPYCLCTTEPFENPIPPGNEKYESYKDRVMYKPYDGRTEYLGLLGFAVPSAFASEHELPYANLADLLTDRTYYPAPTEVHKTLKVRIPAKPTKQAP